MSQLLLDELFDNDEGEEEGGQQHLALSKGQKREESKGKAEKVDGEFLFEH
jgi:hypothetical protein